MNVLIKNFLILCAFASSFAWAANDEYTLSYVKHQFCQYYESTQSYCTDDQEPSWVAGEAKLVFKKDSLVTFSVLDKTYSFRYNRFRKDINSDGDSILVITGQSKKKNKYMLVLGKDYFNFINSKKWGMYFSKEQARKTNATNFRKYNFGTRNYSIASMGECTYSPKTEKYDKDCNFDNFEKIIAIPVRSRMRGNSLYLSIDTLPEISVSDVEEYENSDGEPVLIFAGINNEGSNVKVVLGNGYFNLIANEVKLAFSDSKYPDDMVTARTYSGSGVAISKDILITNAHVIDGMKSLGLYLDGTKIETEGFDIIGQLSDDILDLAILHVNGATLDACPISSKEPELGADVLVYGYPQIQYQGMDLKVTKGIVSGKNGYKGKKTMFQIDAAIQHGNSGGPIVSKGQIIGLATSFLEDSQNANFGIKASKIYHLLQFFDVVPKSTTTDFSKCTYMLMGE
ncbi:MAG: trypsin-like peptidase domain-containing protein [Fibrobacter sp.]|nr:trypsin-like peptidase domain-containing protein [Fibrobacter sp.]